MGKSATGKDSIYQQLLKDMPFLKEVVSYTTRPIRRGEQDGITYHFRTETELEQVKAAGKIIECRTYETAHGPWHYFTVDDDQFQSAQHNIIIGTLTSYLALRAHFGAERVLPIYIEVEDGERLARALKRERKQEEPKYVEMCRRFIADSEDFSAEKLMEAGVLRVFINANRDECIKEIEEYIKQAIDVAIKG